MKRPMLIFAAATVLGLIIMPAWADELRVHDAAIQSVALDRNVPTRGMSMSYVQSNYGIPQKTYAAVGDPPITRWEYDGFMVYFEHHLVIHSVIPDQLKRKAHNR
ncbi:MAG: hypothetical protein SVU69_11705 [Pseudomonadota bacterium]|nr:hypothetical protein [Pseudomonadota bacterium]